MHLSIPRKRRSFILALVFLGAVAQQLLEVRTAFAEENLIVNGRFDTPDLINPPRGYVTFNVAPPGFGWTIVSDGRPHPFATTGFLGVDLVDWTWVGSGGTDNPDQIDQSVDIDGVSSISQSFASVVGQTYVLEFQYTHHFQSPSSVGYITIEGGTTLISETLVPDIPNSAGNMQWTTYSENFVADSATTILTIQGDFANGGGGFDVDDVKVMRSEPDPQINVVDFCDLRSGFDSGDIHSISTSYDVVDDSVDVQLVLCGPATDNGVYRVHFDHTAPFFDEDDRNGDGVVNFRDFCARTQDNTMQRQAGIDSGPGVIAENDAGLLFSVIVSDLNPFLSIGDTVYIWADTRIAWMRDHAPNVEAGDYCQRPEVPSEVIAVELGSP